MSRVPVKPILIAKDDEGSFRITVRETRYNSQGYPIVTSSLQDETFKTATAARTHARATYNAGPTEIATK